MAYALGIDVGTSSCKTVLVDPTGRVVSSGTVGYDVEADGSMDPLKWWRAAIASIWQCCDDAGVSQRQIVAVGCSGQMQGCTFVDSAGAPSRNSLLWCDPVATAQSRRLNEAHGDLFLRECAQPSTPALMGSKIRWVIENDPDSWATTAQVMFASNFIAFMLTGRVATDHNNIGFSGLDSVARSDWSGELVEASGIPMDRLPEVLDSASVIGVVSSQAAEATGLQAGTSVINGTGDVAAECYAIALNGPGELKLRLGSAAAANMVVPRALLSSASHALPYVHANSIVIGSYITTCGLALKWARDTFFGELRNMPDAYSLMDEEASRSRLGANGARYFTGSYGLVGEPFQSRGDVVRACYEGISFSIRSMIQDDAILSGADHVLLCGGGASSSLWVSCLASILGTDLRIPRYSDASYGAALMAGDSVGVLDAGAAASISRSSGRTVRFDRADRDAYEPQFQHYSEALRA